MNGTSATCVAAAQTNAQVSCKEKKLCVVRVGVCFARCDSLPSVHACTQVFLHSRMYVSFLVRAVGVGVLLEYFNELKATIVVREQVQFLSSLTPYAEQKGADKL